MRAERPEASLHAAEGGPAGAPHRLLLLHAMGADHRMWDPARALLETRFRCIAPDQRDAGRSPSASAPVAIESHADDMAATVRARGAAPVIAAGCAIGAAIATALAARHPDTVGALVLINPLHRTRPKARAMLAERAATARARGMQAIMPGAILAAFEGCAEGEAYEEYGRRFVAQDPVAYARQLEAILDCDTSAWTAKIRCPVLILAGGRDRLLPLEHGEALLGALPSARIEIIPEGAHFLPWQRPREVADAITRFTASL